MVSLQNILGVLRDRVWLLGREVQQALRVLSPGGYRQFCEAGKDFTKLMHAFYIEGGLTVPTLPPDHVNAPPPPIRTVIQPDGDFLSFLTPRCFQQPELWEGHQLAIRQELERFQGGIETLQRTFCGWASLISTLISFVGVYPLLEPSLSEITQPLFFLLLWGGIIAILRDVFPRVFFFYLRRQLPVSLRL